jgi:hypothetical protein
MDKTVKMKFDYVFNQDGVKSSEFSQMHQINSEAKLIFRELVSLYESRAGRDQTLILYFQDGGILQFELEYPAINVFSSILSARQYFLRELRKIGGRHVDGMCMTFFALGNDAIDTWYASSVYPMALKRSPADKDEESVCQTMDCHVNSFLVKGNRQHCRVAEAFLQEIAVEILRRRNDFGVLNSYIAERQKSF